MSVLREPWERPEPDRDRAAGSGTHYEVSRRSAQRIGHGSLACPGCDLPLLPVVATAISATIQCPFCGRRDAARSFLRLGASDVPGNRVELIARLPA